MSENYPFPPIVEAVIEVRVDGQIDESSKQQVSRKLAKFYPSEQLQQSKGINIDLERDVAEIQHVGTVVTRSNEDENEKAMLGSNGIAVSQLAAYPSWDVFFSRFKRDWLTWKSVVGHRKVVQIGLRYVNRIDVPMVANTARHEDYLTLQIQLPERYPNTVGYSLMAMVPLIEIQSTVTINSGAITSPIPDFAGFLLDIDIIRQVDVPQKDSDIETLLGAMRNAKNDVFESLITDAARDTFRHEQPLR